MKKVISILMAMFFGLSLCSVVCFGYDNIVYISNESELFQFADSVRNGNSYEKSVIILENDLDITTLCDGREFTPIGNRENPFCGMFDGNKKTITVNIDKADDSMIGLFGYTSGAVISNLTINGRVYGNISVGAFVGRSVDTVFSFCENHANVVGFCSTGGIVGYATGETTLFNCVNFGQVLSFDKQGPFFGSSEESGIINCFSCFDHYVSDSSSSSGSSDPDPFDF